MNKPENFWLYKFVSADPDEFYLSNATNNELIFRHLTDYALNDSYEGHFGVDCRWPSPHKNLQELKRVISILNSDDASINTSSLDAMKEFIRINPDLKDKVLKEILRLDNQYRTCSLSNKWNHILMWAHYSNGFNGMVFAFDHRELSNASSVRLVGSEGDKDIGHLALTPRLINYKSFPPQIDALKFAEYLRTQTEELERYVANEILTKCFLTKFKAWKYEKEVRLIIKLNSCRYGNAPVLVRHPRPALKAVFFGPKCQLDVVHKLCNVLEKNVVIHLTKQVDHKYKLVINESHIVEDIQTGKVKLKKN